MRTNVRERVDKLLTDYDGLGLTYTDIAIRVYEVDGWRPSAAQLSAVRRAVAVLVAEGRAERGERELDGWRTHERVNRYGLRYKALNPGETVIYHVA